MILKISNWDKYNPRRAQKTYTWLRLNNDVFHSPDLYKLTLEEKAIWICILCRASKKNSGEIEFNIDWAAHELKVKKSTIESAIKKLDKSGLCRALHQTTPDYTRLPPALHDTTPTDRQTDKQTDETDGQTNGTEGELASAVLDSISDTLNYEYLEKVSSKIQSAWVKTYGDTSWIKTELNKAVSWCLANPHKTPKSQWAKFFTNWLSRSWESHRKTLPGNSPRASTRSEIDAQHVKNLHRNNPYRKASK